MITIFAPSGLGEVEAGAPLAEMIMELVGGHSAGPLQDGDIVVVTSKIISKAEGRTADRHQRDNLVRDESVRTLARRGATRIVRTRHGLTLAAAGIDNSNVDPELIVLLPLDPDASAATLREALQLSTGMRLGVIISDTAGRTWREGQVDQAIGAAGVDVARSYAGRTDPYGNDLLITRTAYADELASAADLVKTKLSGRPVAVVRGLEHLVRDAGQRASDLVRPAASDLFGYGSREAVLAAALIVTGQPERYEELVDLDAAEQILELLNGSDLSAEAAELLRALLSVDLSADPPLSPSG
jgi:coenzyme F420-0:L-glutamate ligase/coenzyme F420-1:gamma-L-glutamate ligase